MWQRSKLGQRDQRNRTEEPKKEPLIYENNFNDKDGISKQSKKDDAWSSIFKKKLFDLSTSHNIKQYLDGIKNLKVSGQPI